MGILKSVTRKLYLMRYCSQITIPEDASEAPVDLIVEYTDGDIDLIEGRASY